MKKILTFEDLYNFYFTQNKTCNFSSKESGYQIAVQVPASLNFKKNEEPDGALAFCTVKLMHSGENRNHSSVTDEALDKAAKQLAYKPILANFMEYTDEESGETLKDFTSHDMEFNEDGTITYIEKQVGCFTSDEPYFEVEESTGHRFLYGKCAIPVDYTDAYSILERKNGSKISVELAVNEMQYSVENHVLELTDVDITGATLLGRDPVTYKEIGEGMLNARVDIADFSSENNSIFTQYESKMTELQDRLFKLESACFENNTDDSKKGGCTGNMNKFEELLEKYNKTAEDVTFDYTELSDEELEAKFEEEFGNDATVADNSEDNSDDENGDADVTVVEDENGNDDVEGSEDPDDEGNETQTFENMTRSFEVSHEDIRYALYNLLGEFEEIDNEWYYITSVFDTYFTYENWDGGKIYGQKYTKDDDNVAFNGERYSLHKEYLTDSELAELNSMRANYSSIQEKLAKYEEAEDIADKMTVFDDEAYGEYLETAEFKALMNKDILAKFSKEELIEKADAALGKLVKTNKTFAMNAEPEKVKKHKKVVGVFSDFDKAEDTNIYGDYFKSLNN